MLDSVDLDGVVIATPHTLHFEQIMTCLAADLHVLTEKPLACRVDHAKQIIRKAQQKKRVMMISYQRHFSAAFRLAKNMVEEGQLGKITFVTALQAQDWLRDTRGLWRQDPKLSGGGQINDSGSHLVDIILWVTGLRPESVFARINNRGSKVDILSALTLRFRGGAIGTLSVVGDAPGWWEDIAFFGEDGSLFVRGDQLIHTSRDPKTGNAVTKELTAKSAYNSNFDKNFVESILGKDEPQTPPICGLRVIQLTEAAWESAKAGKPVKVLT
ncbi:MAG: Gfo/Idh/MocA family oxidoreductase, partial [Anaerolineae bacterium]|nr:Gfo/Idh/MocA family oxidoreductase [Anaerolineae bacterium]NIN95397.1 Gfo/Idh/MocA family oxidoreductase [Anaerolineae bacterium]NIQ78388.1 Gfo/Idh/MocA family oxidoreductase [Anaerolineae bacterium]